MCKCSQQPTLVGLFYTCDNNHPEGTSKNFDKNDNIKLWTCLRKSISNDGEELERVGHEIYFRNLVDPNYILLFFILLEMTQI